MLPLKQNNHDFIIINCFTATAKNGLLNFFLVILVLILCYFWGHTIHHPIAFSKISC